MSKARRSFLSPLSDYFSDEENPVEPLYDPVHLGATLIISLTALGCIYWLLWTLFVYEGGIFLKVSALYQLLFTPTTLKQLGYEGYPYAMGAFEGWIGNVIALILCITVVTLLRRLYVRGAKTSSRKKAGAGGK